MCKQLMRIIIISLLGSTEAAKVWSGTSSVTAIQGQSVTMQWIVSLTSSDSSKSWTYAKILQVQDGRTTDLMSLQNSGTKTIDDSRYQIRESDLHLNVSQTGASVTIRFTINNLVRSTDEKHYKAMLGFSSDSTTFPGATSLIIQVRPHSTTIASSPNETSYCVNDKITITCVSHADPSASYNLYRNNQLVQSGSSSGLFAVSIALTDRVFLCVPYNTVGTGQNRSFLVHVKEPPKILWCKINEITTANRTVVEGSKVTIMCNISGSEPMNVTWIRIKPSPALTWTQRNLTFNAISRKEDGWYRMNVYNGKECDITASATFHVEVHYNPVGTSISVLPSLTTFCMNDQIMVKCKTEAKPLPEYSLYQNKLFIQTGSKSGIFNFFLLVQGEVVLDCVPSNALGSGQSKSLRVFVKEPPSISRCKVNNLDQTNITVNEGAKVIFSCEFSGTRPLNVTWTKISQTDIHWNQWNLTINDVQWSDNGIYRVTVYNGKECNTAVSRTFSLVVNYMSKLQVLGNSFNVFNKSTPLINFEILTDAYPDITLTCQSAQLKGETVFILTNKKGPTKTHFVVTANTTTVDSNVRLVCTAENEVDSQTTGFLIYKQGDAEISVGSLKLVGQDWQQDFSNVNSEGHKNLKRKCMKMLYDVYNNIPYVQKWDVLRFTPGSMVMYFHLYVIADLSDPFSPLRIAVDKNGGFVGNLEIDPTSIRKADGAGTEGYMQSQTSTSAILVFLGVIVAVSLLINVILIALLLRTKAASKERRHSYDDPNLGIDGDHDHQGEIPLEKRSSLLDDYDEPYHEIDDVRVASQGQPQVIMGNDNPTLNRSLPAIPLETNENQDETQNNSSLSRQEEREVVEVDEKNNERQNVETANEPLKPPTFEVCAENSEGYNILDPSTKIPSRDNRPALQSQTSAETTYALYSVVEKNKYQNQSRRNPRDKEAADERKTQKTREADANSDTEIQNEISKEYNRLRQPIVQLAKESRPVSYEIPIPSMDAIDHKDQNQKEIQSPCKGRENEAHVHTAERKPEKPALKHTVGYEVHPPNEISEELKSNETTA